jgi:release factor glutamine methyltransferase
VFAEDEVAVLRSAARSAEELEQMIEQRVAGRPLEHVVGYAEFCGLRLAVDPGVFVPRRRSELLVREAAALAAIGAVVVDLCCGCGAIGAAIAARVGSVELHATDVDPVAARCARRNVAPYSGQVHEGDLYDGLPPALRGRVDVLVANTPYVPTEELRLLPPEARLFEPVAALDGGRDGLDIQRRVAAGALDWLAPRGHLLVETSERQASGAAGVFAQHGLTPNVRTSSDLGATVVVGARATPTS